MCPKRRAISHQQLRYYAARGLANSRKFGRIRAALESNGQHRTPGTFGVVRAVHWRVSCASWLAGARIAQRIAPMGAAFGAIAGHAPALSARENQYPNAFSNRIRRELADAPLCAKHRPSHLYGGSAGYRPCRPTQRSNPNSTRVLFRRFNAGFGRFRRNLDGCTAFHVAMGWECPAQRFHRDRRHNRMAANA